MNKPIVLEVGKSYKSKNPDDTYMYFKVVKIDNGIKIKVLKDDDKNYYRSFWDGCEVYIPKWGDMFTIGRCKKTKDGELIAVML